MKEPRNLTMSNGVLIPTVGLGVFLATPEQAMENVKNALTIGMRHIDTAVAYQNEKAVGLGIKDSGVDRKEIFLTTKIWPTQYGEAYEAIKGCLERLGTDYIDLVYLHQPYGNYMAGYRGLERAYKEGLIRAIGISNFDLYDNKLREVFEKAEIKPHAMQVECHPYYQQRALKEFLRPYGTVLEAWYPLGHGDKNLLSEPLFESIARKYGKSVVQVILRFHVQEGNIVFPATNSIVHMRQNFDVFDFELDEDEMEAIRLLDKGVRYYYMDDAEGERTYLSIHPNLNQ